VNEIEHLDELSSRFNRVVMVKQELEGEVDKTTIIDNI